MKLKLLLLLLLIPLLAQANPSFSHDQKILKVGYPRLNQSPFYHITQEGQVKGLFPSMIEEIATRSGYNIKSVTYPTCESVMDALINNEVDILIGSNSSPSREQYMTFSKPILIVPLAAITRIANISRFTQLQNKTITVERGYVINEKLKQLTNSIIKTSDCQNSLQALTHVKTGESDAYINDAITLDHLYNRENIGVGLSLNTLTDLPAERLHIGALRHNQELIDKLNHSLTEIPAATLHHIYASWLTQSQIEMVSQQSYLNLTKAELDTVEQLKHLNVSYHANDFPYQFTNKNGNFDGYSADILKLIATKLDIDINAMEKNNINAILASITDGSAQVIPAITCLPERDHVIACTDSYSQEHWSLIGSSGRINNRVNRTDTIGQINDVFSTKLITKYYPNNKVIIFNNNAELVDAIAKGKVDLGIISNSSYSLLKQNEYLGQLRILPSLLDSERKNVSIGTSINNPLLLSSLNKAMAAISEQEFEQIDKKWNAVNIHAGIPLKQLLLWGSVILVILSVIFSSFIYWNRKLTKEISRREIIQQQLVYLSNNFGGVVAQFSQFGNNISSTKCDFISNNTLDYFNLVREDIYANPALLFDYLLKNSEDNDIINAIKHAQQSGYLYTTIKVQSPLGQTTWLQLTGKCVTQENRYHWTCTFIDISQLKLQQAELDNARQLAESATAAKSQFLAMMSHEIRTPISGILSLLELMIPFTTDNELYRIHKNLTLSGQNLLNIVNDVLDFSKIEAGKLSLTPTSCNLISFLSNLVQPHVIHAEQRALKFELWLDPNIAQRLQVDKQRLKQVLNNLLNNAAKFTETGHNMLQVDVVTTTATHQTLCFSVIDSGIGINKPDINKLFMPFVQADISSDRRFNGTGLGLSICRELVLLMGGDINVMSEYHVGSTFRFTITLPVIKPKHIRKSAKKCGLVLATSTSAEIICNYLHDWQCQTQHFQQQLNKIELAMLAAELQLDTILVAESWCQAQEISGNWVSQNLPGVQWIQLRSASLLSPRPSQQGWTMSINPVMPEQLWHILSADNNALPHREIKQLSQVSAGLTREQAIAKNRLILVAEDHPINQEVIQLQLATLGYVADIVDNGTQALAALNKQKYALLISDCHMPELDGYGLVYAIRQQELHDPRQPHLPVIALTADAISVEKDHQALGFDDHLIKPINLPKLQDLLSQWLPAKDEINVCANSRAATTVSLFNPITDSIGIKVTDDLAAITMINMPQLLINYGNLDICLLLLKKFIFASEQDILALADAFTATNHADIRQISHKIKGAALVIECQQLASASATMEQAATEQCEHSRLNDYLNEMISLMVQLKQQLHRYNENTDS